MLVGRAWCFITLVMPSRDVTVAMLAVARAEAFVATRSECVAACRSELVVVKVIARMQQKQPPRNGPLHDVAVPDTPS
jgi:hypothetical protein